MIKNQNLVGEMNQNQISTTYQSNVDNLTIKISKLITLANDHSGQFLNKICNKTIVKKEVK